MYPSDQEAKKMIIDIGRKMHEGGFVTANDGNLSIRVGQDAIWATPTGVNKGDLSEDKLIKVSIREGKILEGTWKPTSELEMHLNIYRTDDGIVSTAHAHPLHLTVLACAGIELDLPSTPAAVCIAGRVPVTPYYCSGSRALAESVIPYVGKYNVINLGNHGPISWGYSPIEAWFRLEDAEASARLALRLAELGKLRPLSNEQVQELFSFHNIRMSKDATVHSVDKTDNQNSGVPFTEFFRDRFQAESR